MVKISVIMPVYNSEKYLEDMIKSILNQNFKEFELILVDDGSKDNSPSICDKYAKIDERVRVIHKENGGICDARNVGLKNAQGEYIMFSDNDDEYLQGALKENYELITNTQSDLVKFGRKALVIDENNKICKEDIRKFQNITLDKKQINDKMVNLLYNNTFVCIWDGIYKKSILTEFDTFFKNGKEDVDYNIKILKNVKRITLNEKVYYNHYIRKSFSTSTKYAERNIQVIDILLDRFNEFIEENVSIDEKYFVEYNIYIMKEFLNSLLGILGNKKCKIDDNKKIELIKMLITKMKLKDVKYLKIWKKSKKYAMEYWFINKKLYKMLIGIMKIKIK